MANTGLFGPYDLTNKEIDAHVGASIGAYALGDANGSVLQIVRYVGRSDNDLSARLKQWVGKYNSFKYGHYNTTKAAFEKECTMFHDFGGTVKLDNDVHPARPKGTSYDCPNPNCDDLD
jgi:hypothetical protein